MSEHPPKLPNEIESAWLFVIGFVLGGIAFFMVFGVAWFNPVADTFRSASLWWFASAAAVSASISAYQPASRLFWSLGFAAPIVGWCTFCTVYAISDRSYLWWTLLGGITIGAAVAGAFLGRAVRRRLS